jgi:transposase-like protein
MKKKAKSYSADFKQEAVRRMAQATTIIGLAKELAFGGSSSISGATSCGQAAGRGWSDAEAGRQGASRRPFPRQCPGGNSAT